MSTKQNLVKKVLLNRNAYTFPTPKTWFEAKGLWHLATNEMTKEEADKFVKLSMSSKVTSKAVLQEVTALKDAIIRRLKLKWDKQHHRAYKEWSAWYKNHGKQSDNELRYFNRK